MFFRGGFGFYGGGCEYDDFGPNRSNWREKSDAAVRRETQAKRLFDEFLETQGQQETTFPVTQEVVPPAVHLTDACWKTFKKYVISKGCTTKRREATREERIASKDSRNGKMYVISVTCPTNPSLLEEQKQKDAAALEEKKKKAAAAAEKKRLAAEKKAAQECALQAKIKQEYEALVSSLIKEDVASTTTGTPNPAAVLKDHNNAPNDNNVEDGPSPKKRLKMTAKIQITVPQPRILEHAEQVHQKGLQEITDEIHREKAQERERLLSELDGRMQAMETAAKEEARQYCDRVKKTIMENGGG